MERLQICKLWVCKVVETLLVLLVLDSATSNLKKCLILFKVDAEE
jgi:hypothetical protein